MPIVPFSGTSVISAQQYGPDGSGRSKSFPQSKEQESAHLCRIRKPLQCPATADRALVMSRSQRFESARRLSISPANPVKMKSPRCSCQRLCQQYVSSRFYLRASSISESLRVFRDPLGCIDGRYTGTFRLPSEVVANT